MDPKHVGLVRFQKYNTTSMTKNTIFFFLGERLQLKKKKKKKVTPKNHSYIYNEKPLTTTLLLFRIVYYNTI